MESQFCLLFKCYAISEFSGHIVMSLLSFQCDTHGTFGGPTRLGEQGNKMVYGGRRWALFCSEAIKTSVKVEVIKHLYACFYFFFSFERTDLNEMENTVFFLLYYGYLLVAYRISLNRVLRHQKILSFLMGTLIQGVIIQG